MLKVTQGFAISSLFYLEPICDASCLNERNLVGNLIVSFLSGVLPIVTSKLFGKCCVGVKLVYLTCLFDIKAVCGGGGGLLNPLDSV